MKFGFDIDDTLIDLRAHAFAIYNKKMEKNIPIDIFHTLKRVEIHEPFGLSDAEGATMWNSSLEEIYFTNCPSFEGSLKMLQALAEHGHDIYYITSRPKQFCAQTKEWMEVQGFPIKEGHFFCGMQDAEKVAIIKELALDVYVDDKPAVLETLHNIQTKVILKNQSYNQHVELPRLHHWQDFLALIEA
ncbi:5' nucleotidase, NT5C type [Lysinibacillus fusiformis]|uniref:5' nucleotidase, NT5C type n=1 Tax=Lysinibacillus fusiformis TaxID=28031 RepID=UPI003D02D15A